MILRGAYASVELACEESLPPDSPRSGDLRLLVRVDSSGFVGESEQVWLGADEFAAFLDALRRLETTREGTAALSTLSPEAFRLEIRAVDRAGRLTVAGRLGRWVDARHWHAIEFQFEFDPSRLGQTLREFARLGQSAADSEFAP